MPPRLEALALSLALPLLACQGAAPRPTVGGVQCPRASAAKLERDPALAAYVATRDYRLGQPAGARPTPDGKTVVYLQSGPRSDLRSLWAFEVASGKARELATGTSLSGESDHPLSREEAAQRERLRLTARGIGGFVLSRNGEIAIVPFGGKIYVVCVATGKARSLASGASADFDPRLSPDGTRVATVEDGEIYVRSLEGGEATRLTHGAGANLTHGLAEFVAQEEMDRFHGLWWSPDSRLIAYEEADSSGVEPFFLVDVAHGERAPEGSPYPRPGKPNVVVRLGVVAASGGPTRWIDWDRARYPYLARVDWPAHGPLLLQVQTRDQKELRLLAVDPDTGKSRTLLTERDPAWVNLGEDLRWLSERRGFLWTSERAGWRRLELRQADGSAPRLLTPPEFGLRRVVAVDAAGGFAVASASPDSRAQDLYRIPLAGGAPVLLAGGEAYHVATGSDESPVLIDREDRLDAPARTVVRNAATGAVLGELPDRSERSAAKPEVELLQLQTPHGLLDAAIVRPHGFDPQRRYPVIDWVYGGPGVVSVVRSQQAFELAQWLADLGFVVVKIDNRGTPDRGRDFERALAGSFARLPLEGQVEGLQALGASHPFMDLARVGVIGASFGGYLSALAVLRRPDLFKAAVAIAPVVTWEDYDTHYTERYVGTPEENPKGYAESSLLEGAGSLSRPLLLVHGTADDNVHFIGTLKLISALEQAGKAPELFLIPGQTHLFADQPTQRLMWARSAAFLLNHLRPGAP